MVRRLAARAFRTAGPSGLLTGMAGIRVWLDDRNIIFRRGLRACLEAEGFHVVGEGSDLSPPDAETDVLVFEASEGGVRRALALARGAGAPRLVGVLAGPVDHVAAEAVEGGVSGLVVRSDLEPGRLAGVVRAVAAGSTALPSTVLGGLLDRASHGSGASTRHLTDRDVAILRLLSEGRDTRGIAHTLGYSERTVKNVVHDMLTKLNCRNRVQAIALATRQGVI